MRVVGKVESIWRYPVKSMRGEEVEEAYLETAGLRGDRRYAFDYSKARREFPYLTARELPDMLLYQGRYRPDEDSAVFVETPAGECLPIQEPRLLKELSKGIRDGETLTLIHSPSAFMDCCPVSLFSLQTARQLGSELSLDVDKRRFRANFYLDLETSTGFMEDQFVGSELRIGSTATLRVIERDERCKMITLDPDSRRANPDIIRQVARQHEGRAGIYASVLVEGMVRRGDPVLLLG